MEIEENLILLKEIKENRLFESLKDVFLLSNSI